MNAKVPQYTITENCLLLCYYYLLFAAASLPLLFFIRWIFLLNYVQKCLRTFSKVNELKGTMQGQRKNLCQIFPKLWINISINWQFFLQSQLLPGLHQKENEKLAKYLITLNSAKSNSVQNYRTARHATCRRDWLTTSFLTQSFNNTVVSTGTVLLPVWYSSQTACAATFFFVSTTTVSIGKVDLIQVDCGTIQANHCNYYY